MLLNCGVEEGSWEPWPVRRSNQSILKEISPKYSLEGLMLVLKLQYFGHLIWRTDSFEKTLILGKIEGRRRRGWDAWMPSLTRWTWVWVDSRSWWLTGRPGLLQSMGLQRVRHHWESKLKLNSTAQFCSISGSASSRDPNLGCTQTEPQMPTEVIYRMYVHT